MTQTQTDGLSALSEHEQLLAAFTELTNVVKTMATAIDDLNLKLATTTNGQERVSSAEVKTSARGVDVSTKSYVGSDLAPAVDAAVTEYFRAQDLVSAEQALRKG